MRQPTLRGTLGLPEPRVPRADDDLVEVYDLFCGAGGFTTGAVQAGCRVVYACDWCAKALETYRRNHPTTRTDCVALPATLPFPTDGRPFHVHGSPPCTRFAPTGLRYTTAETRATAGNLIDWYIQTALESGATSWSMEQVVHADVLAIVERHRRANPNRMAYAAFDFYELGVPQRRKRLIAGSPELVARLQRRCSASRRRGVVDWVPRPRGTHMRTCKNWDRRTVAADGTVTYHKASLGSFLKPLHGPGPTVMCHGNMHWITKHTDGKHTRAVLRPFEQALLQTFPPDYKFPDHVMTARGHIGNAVPPLVARLLLQERDEPIEPQRPVSPSLLRPASSYPVWRGSGKRYRSRSPPARAREQRGGDAATVPL